MEKLSSQDQGSSSLNAAKTGNPPWRAKHNKDDSRASREASKSLEQRMASLTVKSQADPRQVSSVSVG